MSILPLPALTLTTLTDPELEERIHELRTFVDLTEGTQVNEEGKRDLAVARELQMYREYYGNLFAIVTLPETPPTS